LPGAAGLTRRWRVVQTPENLSCSNRERCREFAVSGAVQLLILLAALVVFWAVVMRPARRQQRSVHELQQELVVGDEVVISAGIFGIVRSVDEAKVDLEIAPGTVVTVARQVVVRRAPETEKNVDGQDGAEPAVTRPVADEESE
jgi:preprotein translocase subunit YajC